MSAPQRWYAPAYLAQTGIVVVVGSETIAPEYAEVEAENLRSAEDETEIFVATRLVYPWVRQDEISAGDPS